MSRNKIVLESFKHIIEDNFEKKKEKCEKQKVKGKKKIKNLNNRKRIMLFLKLNEKFIENNAVRRDF